MWYGFKQAPKIKSLLNHKSKRFLNWQQTNHLELPSRSSLYTFKFLLLVPNSWNLLILTPKVYSSSTFCLYMYSNTYFFKFNIRAKNLQPVFNSQLRLLTILFPYFYHSLKFYLNFVKSLFSTFSLPFFLKLKFKGKGYYIFKSSRNTITPQFGFSHRIYVYSFSILVKFLSKTTIFLFGLSKRDLFKNGLLIKNIRPINIFTGRGIRFAKQIIYRKVGKVSSYR